MPARSPGFATALGLGLVAQTLFVLAALHVLTAPAVWVVVIVAIVAIAPHPALRATLSPLAGRGAMLLLFTCCLPSFLLALYPPVGFDATMYHLPFARLFASNHGLAFADTLRFPVFPQLGEMLFTGALLVANDAVAQLTQWLALVVTTCAIFGMAEELADRRAAMVAAAFWIGTPLALYLGGNAYIDMTLTMFVTLAFAAWHRGSPALAGAFAGCAAATKYHGLFFLVVLFAAFAWKNRRAALTFAVVALLFAAPWYVRIARETGNPLFPYLSGIFGRNEWQTTLDARLEGAAADPVDAIVRAGQSPIAAVVHRALLDPIRNGAAPHNPWLLLLVPLALATAIADRRQRFPLFASFAYAAIVWTLDWRFLLAVLPLLAVGIGCALARILPRTGTRLAAVALAAPGLVWMLLLLRSFGPLPVSPAQRDAFLARRIGVYDGLRFLGRTRPDAVPYVLHAENAAYYCPARCLGERYGPYRVQRLDPLLAQPDRLAAQLRAYGADALVLDRRIDGVTGERLARSDAFALLFRNERAEVFGVR